MGKFRLKIHTGAGTTRVRWYKQRLRRTKGVVTVASGTEHVYADVDGQTCDGAIWNLGVALRKKYGTDFGMANHRTTKCLGRKAKKGLR